MIDNILNIILKVNKSKKPSHYKYIKEKKIVYIITNYYEYFINNL